MGGIDWDKLRRQRRAQKPDLYGPHYRRPKHKHHRPRPLPPPPTVAAQPNVPLPDLTALLTVDGPRFHARALWHRHHDKWRCLKADTALDWMLRVRHPQVIQQWLKAKGYRRSWSPCTADGFHAAQQADEPDPTAILKQGSGGPSLNNPTPAASRARCPTTPLELEQTGTSNPCCLMSREPAPAPASTVAAVTDH